MSGGDQLVSPMKVISIHCGTLAGGEQDRGPSGGRVFGDYDADAGESGMQVISTGGID